MEKAIKILKGKYPKLFLDIPKEFEKITGKTFIENEKLVYDNIPNGIQCLVKHNLGEKVEITPAFKEVGIMLDASRNAVFKVDYTKKILDRMAILGYNTLMLYTEDVYEIDDPMFGYMRGKYTKDEIKDIVSYAKILGIEVIPCIQTLGHLEQYLRWPKAGNVRDTSAVLLCESEDTYELIGKMFDSLREMYDTDKIHLGMDEAFDLGFGQYFAKHGYKERFEIFQNHINRVTDLAKSKGFNSPIIWSDMYFAVFNRGGAGSLYSSDFSVGDEVRKLIPESLNLMYWNYWTREKEQYIKMFEKHKDFSNNISMASGIGTWGLLTYHPGTFGATKAAIDATKEAKLDRILFTMWLDDGAYCDFETSMTGIYNTSEYMYFGKDEEDSTNKENFEKIFGMNYRETILDCKVSSSPVDAVKTLWDDPLLAIYLKNMRNHENKNILKEGGDYFCRLKESLELVKNNSASNVHALKLATLLEKKIKFFMELINSRDSVGELEKLKETSLEMKLLYEEIEESFRKFWMNQYKPFGFEVLQSRFFFIAGRYKELYRRILELEKGEIDKIDELFEENDIYQNLPFNFSSIAFSSASRWH